MNKGEIFCKPNLMNDGSKEPEGYKQDSTSSIKNCG